jgi:hypothetical protein
MNAKNIFKTEKIYLREVTMKYNRLVVFIRRYSAEKWGFRYGIILGIGALKVMTRTGVFVRVVFALEWSISSLQQTRSMILSYLNIGKATATKRWAQRRMLRRGAMHRRNRTPTENRDRFDKI